MRRKKPLGLGVEGSEEVHKRLASEFESPPYVKYGSWTFEYQYPGYFMYYHETLPFMVYFTPDFDAENKISIQVSESEGDVLESADVPFFSYTAADLFAIVRQWLDFVERNVTERGVLDWHPDGPKWIPRQ